jgi:hypothetical protein
MEALKQARFRLNPPTEPQSVKQRLVVLFFKIVFSSPDEGTVNYL